MISLTDYPTLTGYVVVRSHCVDISIRATTKAAWESAAVSFGLGVETDEGLGISPGANINEIGSLIVDQGDPENGVPATVDTRHHVNLRIAEPLLSKEDENGDLLWVKTALAWVASGMDDTDKNASETGKKLVEVTMIDQSTISSPSFVWFE